jgi:hypothetical protein
LKNLSFDVAPKENVNSLYKVLDLHYIIYNFEHFEIDFCYVMFCFSNIISIVYIFKYFKLYFIY